MLEWFKSAWDPELPLVEWRMLLLESGWAVPSWPVEWFGRGLPAWADRIAHEAIASAGGVVTPLGVGMGLAAPTLLEHGSNELRTWAMHPEETDQVYDWNGSPQIDPSERHIELDDETLRDGLQSPSIRSP